MDTPVLLAVTGPAEPVLVRALAATPGLPVARRCADVTELLAVAATGRGALAVLSASHLGIDREVVDRLHRANVGVLGLANPEDASRVAALGCDAVVDATAPASAVVGALQQLRGIALAHVRTAGSPPEPEAISPAWRGAAPPGLAPPPPRGQVVAVWGTAGAPGRTVTASALARLLADRGPTCLVDADTRAPSLAPSLGIIADTSGIAVAARSAANGRLDPVALDRAACLAGRVAVLTGLTRPDRWREVSGSALAAVLGQCREMFAWTVVDVAGGWEDDDGATPGPARDAARDAVLGEADVVVIVGSADPVGIWRLVDLLAARPRTSGRDVVVATKSRAGVAGPSPQLAVREALARFAGVGEAIVVPYDRNAFDQALLQGGFLSDVAPDSPAVAALYDVVRAVTGEPASRSAARRTPRRRRREARALV